MADLRAAGEAPVVPAEGGTAFGPAGTGTGVDVLAELERVRTNLLALAAVVEDLRSKHNTHTHGGAVVAPPPSERSPVAYVAH